MPDKNSPGNKIIQSVLKIASRFPGSWSTHE